MNRAMCTVLLLLIVPLNSARLSAQSSLPGELESPKLHSFGIELARNLGATFTTRANLVPLVVGGGATGLSALLDDKLRSQFADPDRASAISEVGRWMGSPLLLGGVSGSVLIAGYGSSNEKLRRVGFDMSQSFLLVEGTTNILKYGVRRERPDQSDSKSFVSGHSSQSFAMAVVIAHHYPKAAIPVYVAASFVAASRVVKDKHWLSDTVAGATVGFIVAQTVVRRTDGLSVGRVSFLPLLSPGGGVEVHAFLRL